MYPVGFWPARVHSKNNILYMANTSYYFATDTPTNINDIDYNLYRTPSTNMVIRYNSDPL